MNMSSNQKLEQEDLQSWIGNSEAIADILTARQCVSLRAILDHANYSLATGSLPQTGHWLLAPTIAAQKDLGQDGHPLTGGFLPPVALPRRMWASSKIEFNFPLLPGMAVNRRSVVLSLVEKVGSTGRLVFVEVGHEYAVDGATAVAEQQTIVYREMAGASQSPKMDEGSSSSWNLQKQIVPTTVMLSRYSFVTFNSHRIHYDQPYATGTEGYPALIVHGPLLATLLANLVCETFGDDALKTYAFRAMSPAFVDRPIRLSGQVDGSIIQLRAVSDDDRILMAAEGTLG